jgi:hypothetical protein
MAIFKLYDSDCGVTVDGVNYFFTHVDSVTIEDPERTRLIRGANSGNNIGLIYKEGNREPKTVTMNVLEVPLELFGVLKTAYKERKRLDAWVTSRVDGSSKIAKNAVLSQEPKQLNMDDTPESMQVSLVFESFDVSETHKS